MPGSAGKSPLPMAALLATVLLAAASPAQAAPEGSADPLPELALEAPSVLLTELPFRVTVHRPPEPAEPDALPFRLVTADGRVLGSGELGAGESRTLEDLSVEGGHQLPLLLESWDPAVDPPPPGEAVAMERADPPVLPGWFSLLPPLVAIALALIFKEVVISLFLGVWLGALFFAGLDPLSATWRTIDRFIVPAVADANHVAIIIFSLLLGGMVGVISRSGGTLGIVEAVRPVATTPRRAQGATFLAGLSIFFDDYANVLIVGNTMRPITDRMRISREKLAYIVDSTAAPIAAIVFVSTWVGFEISLIGDGLAIAADQPGVSPEVASDLLDASPFTIFIHSLPYHFYPLLALFTVAVIILTQRDFGPMLKAENRSSRGDGLHREGAMLLADTQSKEMEPKEGAPKRWYNAVLPVVTVIVVVLLGLYFSGRAEAGPGADLWAVFGDSDPFAALLWGSLAGCLVAMGLAVAQRILTAEEAVEAWLGGVRAMMLAVVILVLAWSLSEVTVVLGTSPYLAGVLGEALPAFLLPALVFVIAALIAFATGTSWGTMGILLPLVIPLAVALGGVVGHEHGTDYVLLLSSSASVLAGAIWGDHCSPISDTTVLSSMASACDHIDHVNTQLPYALLAGVVGILAGSIPTALGVPAWVSLTVGAAVIYLVIRYLGRPSVTPPPSELEEGETRGPAGEAA